MDLDADIRTATFNWLADQVGRHGDVLPRQRLQAGFRFRGERISLVSPQGIHKPKALDIPLTITTTPRSPYDDSFGPDGLLRYRYRGTDPNHRDNVGLRQAFERRRPLAYFHGVVPGHYLAVWPVFIVNDAPNQLAFTVAVDDASSIEPSLAGAAALAEANDAKRTYLTRIVKQRLHQRGFREKVLAAYRSQCALCRLKHRALLDASHIIPDYHEDGRPTVDNGLALCKLHHAAFDSFILGVTPDYIVVVRNDILEEVDGPLLKHGLQELNGQRIHLPQRTADRPKRDALAWRYEQFLATTS